jgi:hypothetical protein
MLNCIDTPKMTGFSYKNLTIDIEDNELEYNLSTIYNLGLPKDSLIVGIAWRMPDSTGVLSQSFSKEGLRLCSNTAWQGAELTLKDVETRTIISRLPLTTYPPDFTIEDDVLGSNTIWFEPRRAEEIDWANSTIVFESNPSLSPLVDYQAEFVIIYYDKNYAQEMNNQINFRSNISVQGVRYASLEIEQFTNKLEYKLAKNSTIGINGNSILVGIAFQYYNLDNIGQSFLTLKRHQTTIVDAMPVQYARSSWNNPNISKQSNWLPVQPTKIKDIDWEASQFKTFIPDNGETVKFMLIYIDCP